MAEFFRSRRDRKPLRAHVVHYGRAIFHAVNDQHDVGTQRATPFSC
jgi:hypothetical protein